MGNGLGFIIIGTILFVAAAALTAFYSYKLSKQFPKLVRAKVTRIETLDNGKFKYHFEGKSGGLRIMEDVVTYKEKKWKVGEKVSVRMGEKGNTCHSDFPIWPIIASFACALMAIIVPVSFSAATADVEHDHDHDQEAVEDVENVLSQDDGYYIVTEGNTFFFGENVGLVKLSYAENHISTGDYGHVYHMGTMVNEEGQTTTVLYSVSASVTTDGTPDDLPDGVKGQVEALGETVNLEVTDSQTIMAENAATDAATEGSTTQD